MNTYLNARGTIHYPFAPDQHLPFPDGLIQLLKISVPSAAGAVYISAVHANADSMEISVASAAGPVGHFSYQGNKHLTMHSDMAGAYGFAVVGILPQQLFNCTGTYLLQDSCIMNTIANGGYADYTLDGVAYPVQKNAIRLTVSGGAAVRLSTSLSNAWLLDIYRTLAAPATQLGTQPVAAFQGVSSVNGISGTSLTVGVQDSKMAVAAVSTTAAVILYVNSGTGFPTCYTDQET